MIYYSEEIERLIVRGRSCSADDLYGHHYYWCPQRKFKDRVYTHSVEPNRTFLKLLPKGLHV